MEFPDLGKHCTFDDCSQLDFLPYTCYHCKKIYCQEHFKLDDHKCPSRQDPSLDIRVPTCPICNKPIPGSRNEDPNIRVNRHIQRNCADDETPSNLCRLKGCKARLLVPMNCGACGQAYCVKHRLEQDHQCPGKKQVSSSQARPAHQKLSALAAMKRAGTKQTNNDHKQNQQSSLNKQKIQQLQTKANRTVRNLFFYYGNYINGC
ncbi:uncharacterized protein BX664DRAFT_328756 [Halteromyces radiatus]|uniref:uncharacterized protein n=1 Tax=Halteromyces radiatus TaxID=101107 RepID=UPI0022201A86|nr:uncharacterized protein BX664DRAFT_328756 [Halteromyces radiatus]KAI8093024.1 hypothetical protein BX664DRAFT_328756 [Halteromyces radiatus]